MNNAGVPGNGFHFKSFIFGLLVSFGSSLFFYAGISTVYKYLPASILILVILTSICFVAFWMSNKYGRYLDVNDVFRKTISFSDFKMRDSKLADYFLRCIRPLNPYVGGFGVIMGLASILLVVPSLIIYFVSYPDSPGIAFTVAVFVMSVGMCLVYYASNKDQFLTEADIVAFFDGVLLGAIGLIAFLV